MLKITTEARVGDDRLEDFPGDTRTCEVRVFINGMVVWSHYGVITLHSGSDAVAALEESAICAMIARLGMVLNV
jgi:hypothetical protein